MALDNKLIQTRLSFRVALVVFIGIMVIEAVILYFSYMRQEVALLDRLAERGEIVADVLASAPESVIVGNLSLDEPWLARVGIRGLQVLDETGRSVVALGELADSSAKQRFADGGIVHDHANRRLNIERSPTQFATTTVRMRLDTTPIAAELRAFVLRIGWLVLLITAFVTLVTVLGLRPLILSPLSRLKRALQVSDEFDADRSPIRADDLQRTDELGDIFRDVASLRSQVVSRQFFDEIVQSISDMLVVLDEDGVVVEANRATLTILGIRPEDLIGTEFATLLDGDEIPGSPSENAESSGELTVDTTLRNVEGRCVPVELSLGRLSTKGPQRGRTVVVVRDITSRVATQNKLLHSQSRFKDFTAAAADWYWEMDADLRFSYFSTRFTEVTGVENEQLLGRTRRETGAPGVDAQTWEEHLSVLDKHQPFRDFVHSRVKQDGSTVWLSINGTPTFDGEGRFQGYRGTGSDITPRIETQEALHAAKVASEEAARVKSEFLANMSHEIRTPMNGVLGLVEILLSTDAPPQFNEHLRSIRSSATGLIQLVNNILDFSKIDAGKIVLHPVRVELRPLIAGVVECFQADAKKRGLSLTLDVHETVPEAIYVDETRLQQVLVNLIGNALKFTSHGSVSVLVSEADNQHGTLCIDVHDTGIGITPGDMAKILEPFSQVDGSTTRTHGGTGLGLSISRQLVELMGGHLDVESARGLGSRFGFQIPLGVCVASQDVPAPTPLPAPLNHVPNLIGLRILVAEDHPVNQTVARGMLELLGCNVTICGDGQEAVARAASETFELIFLDWQMPQLDGLGAARQIRSGACEPVTDSQVPIIAMTANTMQGDREQCLEAGMNAYLGKPFTREALHEVIVEVFESTQPRDEAVSVMPVARELVEIDGGNLPRLSGAVDDSVIAELLALDETQSGLLNQLVAAYEESARDDVGGLHSALQNNDLNALRSRAHRLKSSSGNLGALNLAAMCESLETAVSAGQVESCPAAVSEIGEEFERVCTELDQRILAAA